MSIAALGTAVAGLSKGYMEGSRFRSEMEDAEQMRKKRGIEMEAAELQLGESKERAKAFKQSREIVQKYLPMISGESEEGAAPEAAAPESAPAPRTAGITPPGEAVVAPDAAAPAAGVAAPGAAPAARPRMSKWDAQQKMFTELNMIGLNSGTIPVDKALETALGMSKRFTDAKTDEAIRALQSFDGTNQEAVTGRLANAGINLQPGATFERKKTEAFPGSGIMVDDVVVTSPDGKNSRSLNQMMASRLDPKDWMNMNNEVGYRAADLAFKRQSENNLRDFQTRELDAKIAHWAALEAEQKKQTATALARLGLDKDKYGFEKLQLGLNRAYGQAMDMVGFAKLNEDKLANLSEKERAEYSRKLAQGTLIYTVYELNFDLKKKEPGITMSRAEAATRFAAANRDKVQVDNTGQGFVELDGQKIFVPRPQVPAQTAPAQAAPAQAAPAPAARPAGIANPDEARFNAEQREMDVGRRRDFSPETKAYLQRLDAERAAKDAEYAQRMREQEIARGRQIYRDAVGIQPPQQ